MGQRGSDVSREVADIVLVDDNFASIISAVEEGRNIFENIQKFIRFLFSTNMAFVLIIVFGSFGSFLMGLEDSRGLLLLPMTAVQMLWINIITDGPPALALGFDRNPGVMLLDPRPPSQPLLDRASIVFVATTGLVKALFGGVILIYGWWREVEPVVIRTVMFLFQSIAELVIAYPSRRISLAPLRNPFLHFSVFGGIALQIFTVYFPPLRDMLGLKDPGWKGLVFMSLAAVIVWFAAELVTRYEARKVAFHR
jgi:Ca2+-transporting ATPase